MKATACNVRWWEIWVGGAGWHGLRNPITWIQPRPLGLGFPYTQGEDSNGMRDWWGSW